jgi:F-type H+-transporting ATPase subunit b
MKRLAWILMMAAAAALAQEQAGEKKAEPKPGEHKEGEAKPGEHKGGEEGDPFLTWKWINFAILAAGLGWMIGKSAPAFFKARTEEIQRDMADSARVAADAEMRAAAVEAKISALGQELERMKQEAQADMTRENARLQKETTRAIDRVQQLAGQEIDSAAKVARYELKQYAAQLAVDLAEQRIRTRLTPDVQGRLVDQFVQDLGKN